MKMDKIEEAFRQYTGNAINMCYKIVEMMEQEDSDQQIDTLINMCEIFGTAKPTGDETLPEYIDINKFNELTKKYGDYVDTLLETALEKAYRTSMSKDNFYRIIWEGIAGTGLLSSIEEKAFGLFYIAADRKIPYFQLESGITMDNDDFHKYQKDNRDVIKKICFILSQKFSQRTEEASLLLKELDYIQDQNARAVVFSILIQEVRDYEAERIKVQNKNNDDHDDEN